MTNLFMSQEIYQNKRQLPCSLEPEADFLILIKRTFSRRNARPLYEKDVITLCIEASAIKTTNVASIKMRKIFQCFQSAKLFLIYLALPAFFFSSHVRDFVHFRK